MLADPSSQCPAYTKIKQNLLWAFFFNAVGIPIAASGWLHPTIAIAAMASSTLGILLNSFGLRLSKLATFTAPALEIRQAVAMPAVDMLPVTDRYSLLKTLGWEVPPEDPVALAERWVAEMDRHGIDRMVLLTSLVGDEASVAAAVQAFPERFSGYIRVNPHQPDMPDRVEYALGTLGLRGIKGFPAMECFHAYDEIVYPIYALAAAYQVPVLWHFGLLQSAIGAHLSLPSQADARYSNPMDLQKAARDFPQVQFIIPHFGAGYFGETLLAATHCPNIFIDTSSANGWIRYLPYSLDLQGVFARTLQAVGPERMIFGMDSSWFPRGFRADILDTQLQILAALQVPKEAVELIMGGNIARLLHREKRR